MRVSRFLLSAAKGVSQVQLARPHSAQDGRTLLSALLHPCSSARGSESDTKGTGSRSRDVGSTPSHAGPTTQRSPSVRFAPSSAVPQATPATSPTTAYMRSELSCRGRPSRHVHAQRCAWINSDHNADRPRTPRFNGSRLQHHLHSRRSTFLFTQYLSITSEARHK